MCLILVLKWWFHYISNCVQVSVVNPLLVRYEILNFVIDYIGCIIDYQDYNTFAEGVLLILYSTNLHVQSCNMKKRPFCNSVYLSLVIKTYVYPVCTVSYIIASVVHRPHF